MRVIGDDRARTAFLVLVLSLLLIGDAWRFTFGWWVFGVLAVASAAASGWLLFVQRDRWRIGGLPLTLLAFLALALATLLWSHYPGATALGLLTTLLTVVGALSVAVTFSWAELLHGLGVVLRATLLLSLLFELFVSLVLRSRILPLHGQPGVDYSSYEKLPGMLMWSRNELFEVFGDGRIQGIVGNANNLGFLALLALIVFAVQLATRTVSRASAIAWLLIAAATVLMTKSATVTVALVAVIAVAIVVGLLRRSASPRVHLAIYAVSAAALAAGSAAAIVFRTALLGLLDKSPDLTGRVGIWEKVAGLAEQRPFGWGWVGFWMPWADPFDDLVYRSGVRQLQAHNTWLDVWLQLGIPGLVIFIALVGAALVKAWQHAVDRPQFAPDAPQRFTAITMLPLLVLVALIVQSFAESRLITEYGLALLVVIAVKAKRRELA